jgi:hypothetical protein
MKRLLLLLCASALLGARAEAHLNESSAVARSQAIGGAFVSLAEGPASVFVNPAGIVSAASPALYGDYAEPAGIRGGRDWRLALCAGGADTRGAFGWYRRGSGDGSDDLLAVSLAHRLAEGTGGSFLSFGASATLGGASARGTNSADADSRWKPSADAGIILKPLPVVAFAYSAGNIADAHPGGSAGGDPWRREQRWGVSYFWEDRIVLSFASVRRAGLATSHYGIGVKTAVPLELFSGFSDGRATGGARWTGSWIAATLAFAAEKGGGVTWTAACEARFPERAEGRGR